MDDPTFDRLTKALAGGISRRRLMRQLGGGLGGALGGLLGRRAVTEADGASCCFDSDCHSLTPICAPSSCSGAGPLCSIGFEVGSCITVRANENVQCGPPPTACTQQVCVNGECITVPANQNALCGPPPTPCTQQVCDNGQCVTQNVPIGPPSTPCSTGNLCLQGSSCEGDGTCGGGVSIRCTASDACHVAGTCEPSTGQCTNPIADDGTPCPPTDPCFQTYICIQGVCTGTDPVRCGPCLTCSGGGHCVADTSQNGQSCDDGNACTHNDTCEDGVCRGTFIDCAPPDQCHTAADCDPTTGQCPYATVPDGTDCDDGNACTWPDTCQAGVCTGTPVVCTARDQCHDVGTCDPTTGRCTNPVKPDGTACDDGNACTQTDTCQAGVCVGGDRVRCTASDQCHVRGFCDPSTGQCSNPAAPDGTACNDGNACTQTDTCQAGVCVGSNPVVCAASDQCHVAGTCDPTIGLCSNPAAPDGTPCNAGDNACTVGDACHNGVCVAGQAVVCPSPDACHAPGACDPSTGQCSAPTLTAGSCKSGRIKDGPCDCDGTCCAAGNNCVGQPGRRHCQLH